MEHSYDKNNQKAQTAANNANDKIIQNKAIELQDNRPASVLQKKANNTGLPDHLKSGIENLSGHSMDDVKVHYNSSKPAQLQAHAYAQGTDIHIASGQEKHLPHEAWHVVQQKQGRVRPTLQMKGKVNVNDDKGLENEADLMGAKATSIQLSSGSFNTLPIQRVVTKTQSGKSWKSSQLPGQFFKTKKEAEDAEVALEPKKPLGYADVPAFRNDTKPLARAVRDAAFKAHVEEAGNADHYVEPDLTIAGSSVTGERGHVGIGRPARKFGPRKEEEKEDEGSDYDWNAGHEALAAKNMGKKPQGGERAKIVHNTDKASPVVHSLNNIGGMPGVPHNIMYSRRGDAIEKNSKRPIVRRSHTPVGERTHEETAGRAAILAAETNARAQKAKEEQEQAKRAQEQAERAKKQQIEQAKKDILLQQQLKAHNDLNAEAEKKKEDPWSFVGGKKKK
ncbi:DUF4157 domain-containing protein [Flavobacterium sp. FlaQc-48]|uniref:eCIS core domain-containing protein n=1 Tax=Flavobacterium sp. FlaQc-48 TaxID=3374181 RepID=UPI003756AEF5